ncbi:PRODH [Symbiodinium natans]|uniref:proline dehydrogenase n=1 Tax=Symbiodinium natans TaxID=878477 RepID=A0A812RZJ2_9DINO|nr:PRODH [Symbiodinium natans]
MSRVGRLQDSISDLRCDVLTLVLSFSDVVSLARACSLSHAAARVAVAHEHWHWFVLQYFGVYYDDYMRSCEVSDDSRWRRLFIFIRQVHHNVDQQKAVQRTMPALLRPCAWLGKELDGAQASSALHGRAGRRARRRRYRGSLELADHCNVFFWENGRVVQVVRSSDGQVIREIDTGQTFRRCFHRLANIKNRLFVCLNDCIKVWEYDTSQEPITLPEARCPGSLARGRPLELLVHRQRLILVESSCCLLWHTETLDFICCIQHDDAGAAFGHDPDGANSSARDSERKRDALEVQWMGDLLMTWQHPAADAGHVGAQARGSQRSLNVWTLDGEPRAFLETDAPLVQVDVTRVTWVSVYTLDHFILCALDSRSVVTLWDSKADFSPIFRFYSGCEEPFDLVLTQDFLIVIQDNIPANRLDLFFWKLWLHPDFEVEGQSIASLEAQRREGKHQREASVTSRLPAGARFAPQGAAFPAPNATALTAVLDLASAAAAHLSGDALLRFLYRELQSNCRLIKTLSIPDVDTYFASYRNFLNICSFHKSGQESLSVYRSSSLQKKVFFPPAKHTKFEEWIALQVKNDGTVVVHDFRPSQVCWSSALPVLWSHCPAVAFSAGWHACIILVCNAKPDTDGSGRGIHAGASSPCRFGRPWPANFLQRLASDNDESYRGLSAPARAAGKDACSPVFENFDAAIQMQQRCDIQVHTVTRAPAYVLCALHQRSGSKEPKAKSIANDFTDASVAFESKSLWELVRAWCVFQICAVGLIVRHCDTLYDYSIKILGSRFTHLLLRKTFFDHFCAGESSQEIVPRMHELRKYNVGGILDYAAEAKDGELPEIVKPTEEVSEQEIVGAPMSSRTYDYKNEALCDANAKIFRTAVRAVKDATPDGFAAIKLSGLGNPQLLERMSSCLGEICRLYKRLSHDDEVTEPFYAIDRSFKMDFETFKTGWFKMFEGKTEAELKSMFQAMDADGDGQISYLEWSSSVKLSEINELVRGCKHRGRMYQSALNEEELQLYRNMLQRIQGILDLAQELGVRVMIDAEWTDIQPAIDHITIFMQRIYNSGDLPIVFNTYQTYLKGMPTRVQRDLHRSRREGWRFGAKLVRGAYMVSEREKALKRGLESPICESYEETEENFHQSIDLILEHGEDPGEGPGGAPAEVLVASHNRGSIERTIRKMAELGVSQDRVGFGQLLGMADHLTFTLGRYGYRAYKYVPYGPVDEVVPYLIRRTQENSAILGSPSVQEERHMVGQEVARRLRPF